MLLSALDWTSEIIDAVVCGDEVEAGRPPPAMILEAMRTVKPLSLPSHLFPSRGKEAHGLVPYRKRNIG